MQLRFDENYYGMFFMFMAFEFLNLEIENFKFSAPFRFYLSRFLSFPLSGAV